MENDMIAVRVSRSLLQNLTCYLSDRGPIANQLLVGLQNVQVYQPETEVAADAPLQESEE